MFNQEWKKLLWIVLIFLVCFFLPVGAVRFDNAILEALHLVKWYAQEHVLLCLIPAFFIAGAIGVFVSQTAVMRYLGPTANKILAYGVASVSGTILAVCSCTILPLFAGIYRMGAGLGPACAFLYSGPAINVLAIILTARILGLELGIARAIGAISFSILIGLLMHWIYRKEQQQKAAAQMQLPDTQPARPLWQNAVFFALMVGILVFANWGKPQQTDGLWHMLYTAKWLITAILAAGLAIVLGLWFAIPWWKIAVAASPVVILSILVNFLPYKAMAVMLPFTAGVIGLSWLTSTQKGDAEEWFHSTWTFAKQILPLLLFGVLAAGFLLGRVGQEGIIPSIWVQKAVGGNSIWANFFASFVGAFMYFATLTEVPILQGLLGAGMGKGPALALLLAGPALSLPNMLVIRSIMGTGKTIVFIGLVIIMATLTGILYGAFFS